MHNQMPMRQRPAGFTLIQPARKRARRTAVAFSLVVPGFFGLPVFQAGAAYEKFNYADGALEGAGGTGAWSGPWQAGPVSTDPYGTTPFQVQSGQMRLSPTDTTLFGYNESDIERSLATPIASSSVYIGFQITTNDMGTVVAHGVGDSSVFLTLGFADNATNIEASGPTFSMYEFYQDWGATTYTTLSTSLGGVYDGGTDITTWTPGSTYNLVGRLEFDAVGADERWTVWLDPADESSLPAVVTTADLGYNSIGLARMWHYVYNYENIQDSFVDDLRIGSSWQSVTAVEGDLDGDDKVDFSDFVTLSNNYNGPNTGQTWATGDLSGDGDVAFEDFVLLSNNYGYNGSASAVAEEGLAVVPEPSSLALLGLGGLIAIRRRRQA